MNVSSRLRPSLLLAGATTLLVAGCGFDSTPGAAPVTPLADVGSPVPAPGEAQDGCTQLALTLLDGLLNGVPSTSPEQALRANEVVQQFVAQYDRVIVASGVPAARAQFAQQVAQACQQPATGAAAPSPAPVFVPSPPAVASPGG